VGQMSRRRTPRLWVLFLHWLNAMEGVVRAVHSGLSLHPSDALGVAFFFTCVVSQILHLLCKDEVFIKAPKLSVYLFP
jgi:hypothetical protein